MKVEVTERDGANVVAVEGDVDMSTAPDLRQILQRVVSNRPDAVIVDLSGVPYIDSSGLATLVECYQGTQRGGGRMGLSGLSQSVFEVFRMTHLDKHFTIYSTLDEAVTSS